MKETEKTSLLKTLSGEAVRPVPIWLMRQAGRYLPEYRALRERAGSFWTMATTPELAADVTLQPIARFGFDAAIIFSDILTVPYALGRKVTFEERTGPRLEPINAVDGLVVDRDEWAEKLAPCYAALRLVRERLDKTRSLIGFAGAPWTLATYMAEGGGSSDQRAAKLWGYRDPKGFGCLLDVLGDCVSQHLVAQIDAGADTVQLFDSWASGLAEISFREWVIAPTKRIVENVRRARPDAKIIGFPRGTTLEGYRHYARETGVDAVSIDTAAPIQWAVETISPLAAIQGNLDPIALIAGGAALSTGVDRILVAAAGVPFVFNLGHGILPETPLEHVSALVARVRQMT